MHVILQRFNSSLRDGGFSSACLRAPYALLIGSIFKQDFECVCWSFFFWPS